ncbi:hypothetical protein [Winogradskyella ludwigii]|uniref:hypothetical protein n=1 Tax=Winogradskyella ludwigii TaxID=2686076 RepID=UPI001C53EB40|nr:hypothetical protein [Winogradskyella ludwigii]
MKKELEEITNMQDFKIFLEYPRENEDKTKFGIHKKMGFRTCEINTESMISWFKKNDDLYLIRVSKECIAHIKKPRFGIGSLPMMCDDLRFVKGVNSGITKNGDTFTSIEILMPNELSEQEEYRNSHPTKEEVYKEMREENYKEETFNDYNGSHAQDYAGYSDQQIDDIFDGDADLYWNID